MRFYISIFIGVMIMLQFCLTGHAQYIPTYLQNHKAVVAKPIDSLASFPGRKKLIQCIEKIDGGRLAEKFIMGRYGYRGLNG